MIGDAGAPHPAGFLAGWPRWAALAVFAALVVAGLLPLNPNPPAAAIAAAVAVGAGALLVQQRPPLLAYAAVATAGVAVLGNDMSSNVGWFAVCLVAACCALIGPRRDIVVYWAGAVILFAAEWAWLDDDPGWAAWMGGTTLSVGWPADPPSVRPGRAAARGPGRAGRARQGAGAQPHRPGPARRHRAHADGLAAAHHQRPAGGRARPRRRGAGAGRGRAAEPGEPGRGAAGRGDAAQDGDAGRTTPLPGADGLPALVQRFRSAGADVTLTVDGDPRLPATTGLAVYRILQEALTNAANTRPAPHVARLTVEARRAAGRGHRGQAGYRHRARRGQHARAGRVAGRQLPGRTRAAGAGWSRPRSRSPPAARRERHDPGAAGRRSGAGTDRPARILRDQFGFDIVGECADGSEVIAAVESLTPDVVLMDVRMPMVDGVQATRELRRHTAARPCWR